MTETRFEDAASRHPAGDLHAWLERASAWQFVSLCLQPPSVATGDQMLGLLGSLPHELAGEAKTIASMPVDEWEPEFFSVLGPAGCPACESSYERAAMASRGPLLGEIAGFYEAFGYRPDHLHEVPDHASVELGFLAFLAMKVAFAEFEADSEAAAIARGTYDRFLASHFGAWADSFGAALIDTGSRQYTAIARLIEALTGRRAAAPGTTGRVDEGIAPRSTSRVAEGIAERGSMPTTEPQ